MKIAYLECNTGISGDMTLAALIDAGVDEATIQAGIQSLQLPGAELKVGLTSKNGFRARSIQVQHPRQSEHRHLSDIINLIEGASALTPSQRSLAVKIFRLIAEAEAHVHGMTPESVHFHEVGAIDSIVDIVGVAIGFDLLGADQIVCGPIPTGRGQVRIEHGLCAIPAPGTAELLKGIPLRDLAINAELTTPTGAAIVRTLANCFGPLPEMRITAIGSGAGTLDLPGRANILRLFVGETDTAVRSDEVCQLETNLDDVTGEIIGYTRDRLLAAGALDVFSIPIQMKKNRPGTILCVLCQPEQVPEMEQILFKETGTLGIRRQMMPRTVRPRQAYSVFTQFGPVAGKLAWSSSGAVEFSPEFDACAQIAVNSGQALRTITRAAEIAFELGQSLGMPVPPLE